jgi:phosphoglycolate phosphatase
MKIPYVFFDLDGTLTDPGVGITNAVMYALKRFGIEVKNRQTLYSFIGPPLLDSFREHYGFDETASRKALEYYREYFEDTGIFENRVYEGIPEMLDGLKKAGKKLVLATSKPEMYASRILDHFSLSRFFSFQAGSLPDEKRSRKSEVITFALECCKIDTPDTVIMVGDRKYDVEGARVCGIRTLGVLYGYGGRKELEGAGADYIAETVGDAGRILQGL